MALGGERARLVGEDARDEGRELDRPPRRVARTVAGPARGAVAEEEASCLTSSSALDVASADR